MICPNCENEIDPDCCHCGSPIKNHGYSDNHSPVPMGCTCGYAVQPPKPLKMYILVKKSLPSHKMIAVAHGVLMAHLKFSNRELQDWRPLYEQWLNESFRKVVCEVSDADFERFREFSDRVIVTESGLDNMEVSMVFCPRAEWPKPFKYLSMSKY